MLALSDSQLRAVWTAAGHLPAEKRGAFLERLIAQLQLRGSHFTTTDLEEHGTFGTERLGPAIGSLKLAGHPITQRS